MAHYYFDFTLGDLVAVDEEGRELISADAAHKEALSAVADAIEDVTIQGQLNQRIIVDVRDHLGPVLQVSALIVSKILRKN